MQTILGGGGANSVVTGRMLKTRAELLFAINIWMKQFHQPELTVNDLIVRIADQQIEREPIPRAEYILERIVKNRRFDLPVDLWMNQWENMTLSEQYSSNDRISLPAHYTLAIRVLNVPWDSSLDRDGNQLKVDFTKVPIAYAFSEEKGVVKTKRKPNRKHVTDKRAQMP
ncbi:MAG: hypothetical protein ABJF10_25065 [Chthoniobacter sp.]|uniref:hypothetical protein n=1 Tax=Chthoniobacter sp. TaxID=2510640 RepID=UPI0032AE6671